jgi:5-methylcytosine-specific restriction endonuclease McrA
MTIRSGVVGKTGRLRLKGKAMDALRWRVFQRDNWHCQECGRECSWEAGHLAHIKSRGAGGSDTEENTRLLCMACHHAEHNCGGKPLPRNPYAQGE